MGQLYGSSDFRVDYNALKFGESDREGIVLGVFHQGQLISTMRLNIEYDELSLSKKLDFDDLGQYISFPAAVLGKAGTAKNFLGRGLNGYLRKIFMEYLLESEVDFVAGTVIQGAPRLKTMKDLGYEFLENSEGWYRYGYRSHKKVLVAYLNLKTKGEKALKTLTNKANELEVYYPNYFSGGRNASHQYTDFQLVGS